VAKKKTNVQKGVAANALAEDKERKTGKKTD
jgi:hypothetical protein